MNILLYGPNGFVGRHLKTRLIRDGHTVIDGTRDFSLIPILLEEPVDVLINCAGEITHPHKMYEANVALVERLLRFACDAKIPKMIQIGSSSEYGAMTEPRREDARCVPNDLYSATKIAATMLCQGYAKQYDMDVCVARPFSLYGPDDTPRKLIPRLIASSRDETTVEVDSGYHDYLYIDDFIDALLALLYYPPFYTQGEIVNLGSGIEHSNEEVAALIKDIVPTTSYRSWRTRSCHHWVADTTKARERYGWTAKTSLKEGLKLIINS